jgi:hypothetical protein
LSSIREILFKELEKRSISVYQFSKETGIPKGRIYKWKDGEGSPKEKDIAIIRQWMAEYSGTMDTNLVEVPTHKPDEITIPAKDYIKSLERNNEFLGDSIQANLTTILKSQDIMFSIMDRIHRDTQELLRDRGQKNEAGIPEKGDRHRKSKGI